MTTQISGDTGVSAVQAGVVGPTDLSGQQSGNPPIFGARAWCKFNGTTVGTNPPTAGGNVTSVTRNAAGDYTVNFTTAMPDADYAVSFYARTTAVVNLIMSRSRVAAPAAGAFRFDVFNTSIVAQDCEEVFLVFYR